MRALHGHRWSVGKDIMPIYEYRCGNCGHELETLQKLSEAPLRLCPACGQEALSKKVSAAGFRLKGGGWYETDFKSGSKRNVASDAGSGDSGGSSSAGASAAASSATSSTSSSSGSSSSSGGSAAAD